MIYVYNGSVTCTCIRYICHLICYLIYSDMENTSLYYIFNSISLSRHIDIFTTIYPLIPGIPNRVLDDVVWC